MTMYLMYKRRVFPFSYHFSIGLNHTLERVVQTYGNETVKWKDTPLAQQSALGDFDTPSTRIKKARMERNLYIYELARLVGASPTRISQIERGEIGERGLRVTTVKKLAKALNKPIWYIGCYEKLPEKTFGQKLKKARLHHGHTQSEAAKILGVNAKTIRNWELDYRTPSNDKMDLIKRYLEILNFPNP